MRFLRAPDRVLFPGFITALVPYVALAAPKDFSALADLLVRILTTATETAIGLVFVLYFYGIASDLRKLSTGEASEKRREFFFWAIVALFVMISVGGIVALLQNTLFGGATTPGSIPLNLGD